jgi:hypothetical protein
VWLTIRASAGSVRRSSGRRTARYKSFDRQCSAAALLVPDNDWSRLHVRPPINSIDVPGACKACPHADMHIAVPRPGTSNPTHNPLPLPPPPSRAPHMGGGGPGSAPGGGPGRPSPCCTHSPILALLKSTSVTKVALTLLSSNMRPSIISCGRGGGEGWGRLSAAGSAAVSRLQHQQHTSTAGAQPGRRPASRPGRPPRQQPPPRQRAHLAALGLLAGGVLDIHAAGLRVGQVRRRDGDGDARHVADLDHLVLHVQVELRG